MLICFEPLFVEGTRPASRLIVLHTENRLLQHFLLEGSFLSVKWPLSKVSCLCFYDHIPGSLFRSNWSVGCSLATPRSVSLRSLCGKSWHQVARGLPASFTLRSSRLLQGFAFLCTSSNQAVSINSIVYSVYRTGILIDWAAVYFL